MRRKFSAILLLIFFMGLQFGKVATYIYCEWQAQIVLNDPNCDCDDHLASMFGQHDDESKNDLSKITVNEKLNEFTPKVQVEIQHFVLSNPNCFTEYNTALSEIFPESPFHPPIA